MCRKENKKSYILRDNKYFNACNVSVMKKDINTIFFLAIDL